MGQFTELDVNDGGTVGLVRYDGDTAEEYVAAEAVDPDLLIEAAERAKKMGWDVVDVNVHPNDHFPILIHERKDDQGIYVAIAPVVPDEEADDVGE